MEFVLGGVAAIGAGFFTNPLDVIKTRLQLQGELQARGLYTVHYRGFFHAFYAVAKADGILALQKGLVPALWYQLFLNGVRLGTYDFAEKRGWTSNNKGEVSIPKCMFVGAVAGVAGAFSGSPFYLVSIVYFQKFAHTFLLRLQFAMHVIASTRVIIFIMYDVTQHKYCVI